MTPVPRRTSRREVGGASFAGRTPGPGVGAVGATTGREGSDGSRTGGSVFYLEATFEVYGGAGLRFFDDTRKEINFSPTRLLWEAVTPKVVTNKSVKTYSRDVRETSKGRPSKKSVAEMNCRNTRTSTRAVRGTCPPTNPFEYGVRIHTPLGRRDCPPSLCGLDLGPVPVHVYTVVIGESRPHLPPLLDRTVQALQGHLPKSPVLATGER